ncbi:MAG: FprA family A-type flavoprotein [Planctomycetes bacterium]|nr:FprA family A-type flavoprotein [Planctomycetota bacterium]
MNTQLRENIHWVGYVDWSVRDFHGYNTNRGATYNAYLLQDEKTALIDTVKGLYLDHLLDNIRQHTPLEKIDYIICNHSEHDHSSSLPRVLAACPQAVVVCDQKCREFLKMQYDISEWNFQIVKTGDTLTLGKRTLQFMETPMVHWPDSMFTYVVEEKLLFSMDAFGQHFASSHRFDDEVDLPTVMAEAKTYYANIVMLYGKQIAKVLEQAARLEIEMIAPSHGVIWRSHIAEIVAAYQEWVVCQAKPKVVVLYDSMWGSTKRMAEAITQGAALEGVEAKLISVRAAGITEVATEVLDAGAIAFGSATLNMGMMPMMSAALTYLKGLHPVGKAGIAFGSYGWGKGATEDLQAWLQSTEIEILGEPLKCKFRPNREVLAECETIGRQLAEKARELAAR